MDKLLEALGLIAESNGKNVNAFYNAVYSAKGRCEVPTVLEKPINDFLVNPKPSNLQRLGDLSAEMQGKPKQQRMDIYDSYLKFFPQ